MASKRTVSGVRKRVDTPAKRSRKKQEKTPVAEVKSEYPSGVSLRLRLGSNVKYVTVGKTTGKKYVFQGTGHLLVDALDAPEMLTRTVNKRPCCGIVTGKHIFCQLSCQQ